MKKILWAIALCISITGNAHAAATYLGVDTQDVNITSQDSALNVVSTATTIDNGSGGSAVNIQDGGNSITVDGTVSLTTTAGEALVVESTSTIVSNAAGASAVNIQDGGNSLTVDGTVNIDNLTFSNDKVDASGSTLGTNSGVDIGDTTNNNGAGASAVNVQDGGNSLTIDAVSLPLMDGAATSAKQDAGNTSLATIAGDTTSLDTKVPSQGVAASAASMPVTIASDQATLNVLDTSKPNLSGKAFVYASDNAMSALGTITITGLAKELTLQAISGSCTFDIDGGNTIVMRKNTAEAFDFAYTLTSPTITLSAKDASATCKARLTGAN